MTPPVSAVRPFAVTHGTVFRLAVPMTLAYLSLPLVGIIDTAAIGRLGQAALVGGIAVGAIVLDIVFAIFNFLRAGTTGLTAQAFGAEDGAEVNAVLLRALLVAGVSAIAVLAAAMADDRGRRLPHGSRRRSRGGDAHLPLCAHLGDTVRAGEFVILGWLVGLGRSLIVLLVQTIFAGLNIGLSLYFVLGLGLGVAGVAWSSVLAEVLTLLVQVPVILKLAARNPPPGWSRILDRNGFSRLIAINRDIMIRSLSLFFAFAFFTRQGAHFGPVVLAANVILMHFFLLGGYFLDGYATAAEQLAGRAVGARFRPAFDRVVRLTALWGFATALALSLLYLAFGPSIIDIMSTAPDVRETARRYLVWAVLTPIAGVIAFQMDGIFIGATWSRDMRNMMLLSLLVFLAAWAVLTPAFGNDGLWMALLIFLGARSVAFHWRMRRLLPRTFPVQP